MMLYQDNKKGKGFLLIGILILFSISFISAEIIDTPNLLEKWILNENTAEYKNIKITPMSNKTTEIEGRDFSWESDSNSFWIDTGDNLTESPLSEFHWNVSDLRTPYSSCEKIGFVNRCYYERIDFSSFREKNNVTQNITPYYSCEKIDEIEYCNLSYYLVSFNGTIVDLDPEVVEEYTDTTTAFFGVNTNITNANVRLINPSLNGTFSRVVDAWFNSSDTSFNLTQKVFWHNMSWVWNDTSLLNQTNVTMQVRTSNSISEVFNTSDLRGWWNLNQNDTGVFGILDQSGNDNNGTVFGNATFKNNSDCYPFGDGCYGFNKTNHITIGNTFTPTSNFTLSVWVKVNSTPNNYGGVVVTKPYSASNNFGIFTRSSGFWEIQVTGSGPQVFATVGVIDINEWTHLALVYNSSTSPYVRFYLNGVLNFSSGTDPGALTSRQIDIGSYSHYGSTIGFDGKVDSVQIYNRTLTEEEITWNFFHTHPDNFTSYSTLLKNNTFTNLNNITGNTNARFIQYNAFLNTTNSSFTPNLSSVTFNYSNLNATRIIENVSLFNFDLEVPEVIFNTPTYETVFNGSVNLTKATHLVFKGSGQLRKATTASPSTVSMRIKLNGNDVMDTAIRTVSNLNDRGAFSIPINHSTAPAGQNNITIEVKEDGSGSVNMSNFELHIDTNITSSGSENVHSHDSSIGNFSSISFINIANFSINKINNASTYLDYQHLLQIISGTGSSTPTCFLRNNITGEETPSSTRYLASSSDTGNSGMNYLTSLTTIGLEGWELWCQSSDTDTIQCNATIYLFEMANSGGELIQGFQNESVLSGLTGSTKVMTISHTFANGTGTEMKFTGTIQSTSGIQNGANSPTIVINSSTISTENCSISVQRSLNSNSDIGVVMTYLSCEKEISVGETHTFDVYIDVASGETIDLLNSSLSGYEIIELDTTTGLVSPLVVIINPLNGTTFLGVQAINISATDISNIGWESNVTLLNTDGTFNFTILNESTFQNTTGIFFNTSLVPDDTYFIQWNVTNNGETNTDIITININNIIERSLLGFLIPNVNRTVPHIDFRKGNQIFP